MKEAKIITPDCEIMDPSIWENLPPEIIHSLIARLPTKSLCRFKSVSTSWNSLISSSDFAKTHLHITNNTPNRPQKTLLISLYHKFYSIDFATASPTAEEPSPTAEELDFDLCKGQFRDQLHCWGSCNGLFLAFDRCCNLFLLNPSTRECKELPDSPLVEPGYHNDLHFCVSGLGYDSSTDDYKVVMLLSRDTANTLASAPPAYVTNAAVYSLKTNAWRRIQDPRYNHKGYVNGVWFDERLHWLCWRNGFCGVLALDLWDETFRVLDLHPSFDYYRGGYNYRMVSGSCLCLVVWPFEGDIDVWMMMKYGVRESWAKLTIALGMSLEYVSYLAAEEKFVLRMIEKVNGVGVQPPGRDKLVVYNLQNGTLRDMVVCGIPTEYLVGGNYIETLVSPNHG